MNTPNTVVDLRSVRKLGKILGENCEEYIVNTIIIVEKVKVIMVNRAADMVVSMSLAKNQYP